MLSSTRSTCVRTPMVRIPYRSIYLASFKDSELAESSVAFDTAIIMQFGFFIYPFTIFVTCSSMSFGWSPIGFWIDGLLPSRFQGDPRVTSLALSLNRISLEVEHCWFLCLPHMLYLFRLQLFCETHPCFRKIILSFQRIRHTIYHY